MNRKLGYGIAAVAAAASYLALPRDGGAAPGAAEAAPRRGAYVVAAGRVEPYGEEVRIGAELDGRLERVLVEEGDEVRAGQVLAVLRNADFTARVATARAKLAERRANLERLTNGAREEERLEAEAVLREAEALKDNAGGELERRRTLLARGAVSRSEHELAEREFKMAEARAEAARQRLALVRRQTREEDLERGRAEAAQAEALVAEAQAALDKTVIRSPLAGKVLRRYKQSGESVTAGETAIVSLGDCRSLRVRVEVDERDVAQLRLGQTGWVRAEAFGERKFTGRVVRIGQALGRKHIRTDEPAERVDTKVLETLMELDAGQTLPVGLRVDAWLEAPR